MAIATSLLAAWTTEQTIIFFVPIAAVAVGVIICLLLRKTVRSRTQLAKQLEADPDIHEYLVVFNWSRKVLYLPTILVSLAAGVVMLLVPEGGPTARVVGGVWLGVFFLNFLIDEYEMSIKVLLIVLLLAVLGGLWLAMLGWFGRSLGLLGRLRVSISAGGYFLLAAIFIVAVLVAWIRGLFYYVAITPNYMNVQTGPTETGEQVNHADYSTRIDTGDFLERLLGFGRIIVTFRDNRRAPMILLVGRVGPKARTLEALRGKLAMDMPQPAAGKVTSGPD